MALNINKKIAVKLAQWQLSCFTQWLAAFEGFMLCVVGAGTLGWMSPFLGHLSRPNPPFEVTKEQTTWIVSLVSVLRPIGTILAAIAINRVGTKTASWLSGLFFLFGWSLMFFATTTDLVFASIIFVSVGFGASSTSFTLYLGEISKPDIRGALIGLVIHGKIIGVLIGNLAGALLPVWNYAMINLALTVTFLITFYLLPHSPHYLIMQDQETEAEAAIQWYNRNIDVTTDMQILKQFLERSPKLSVLDSLKKLNTPLNRRVLLILNVTFGLIQFSGLYVVLDYAEIIFIKANVTIIKPSTLVSIMTTIAIPGCWLAMWTTDRFGRTTMLFLSCFIFSGAFVCWAVNFHLLDLGYNDPRFQWIVIITTIVFRFGLNIGIQPIVPILISELFAPNIKSVGACVCSIFMALCQFISSKNFQFMVDHLTYKCVFLMFAGVILFNGFFSKYFIPETKGKSLAEIQTILNKNNAG